MTAVRPIRNYEEPPPPPGDYTPRNGNGRAVGPRVPPHDLAAEASLLGAMLLTPSAIEAAATLTAADYYKPAHGHIHDACVALHAKGEPADPVTVAAELQREGLLEHVGGATTLVELQAGTPATSNAPTYARLVKDRADCRALIVAAADIADIGYSLPEQIDDAIGAVTALVERVAARRTTAATSMFADLSLVSDELDPPALCPRSDGACAFIYEGRVHSLIGPSEAGKSWVIALWCRQLIDAGRHVVLLDWEDNATGWKSRLTDMGVTEDTINEFFHYSQRDEKWTPAARAELARSVAEWKPALVAIDAMTPALATEGLDDWRGIDIAAFLTDVVRVCRNAGAAVLIIDHVNKKDESQTGSQYKRAGIDGVQYKVRSVVPMGRGKRGLSAVTIGKDRHGFLRGIAVGDDAAIGTLVVDSTDGLEVEVGPPVGNIGTRGDDGSFRMPKLMEALSRVIEAAPEGVARTGAYAAVKGNRQNLARAMAALLKEGWCIERSGPSLIVSVTPFRCEDDSQADF